jgi:hypothetical protein
LSIFRVGCSEKSLTAGFELPTIGVHTERSNRYTLGGTYTERFSFIDH